MILDGLFRRSRWGAAADALYLAAVQQARRPGFYTRLGVPDTVDGRFDMIALHVFLLLRRLRGEGKDGAALAQKLFDVMFDYMDQDLREMGVGDLSVGKKIKAMASAVYGRIAAYEPGLDEGGAAGETQLVEALRRNLYSARDPHEDDVRGLARYVVAQAASLAAQSGGELLAGRVEFLAAPHDDDEDVPPGEGG
jgi:cytochrome b pre-mRNA-processing protein 3